MISPSPASSDLVEHISAQSGSLPSASRFDPYLTYSACEPSASGPPAQGASVQCMQAIEIERSPGLPSLMVTTRRRLMPHGTSCSFLQAVTQALHSMQRSASQRNFILAISAPPVHAATIWQSVHF